MLGPQPFLSGSIPGKFRALEAQLAALEAQVGDSGIQFLTGSADPSAGAGVEATSPALYARVVAVEVTSLWLKTGAADTAWTQLDLNAYSGTLTSLGQTALATTLQGAIDAVMVPGNVDTFSTPGNVNLTATPWVRRIRCALANPSASLVITHPRLTTTAFISSELEGSTARVFHHAYSAGSVTLTTSSYTALAVIVFINSF